VAQSPKFQLLNLAVPTANVEAYRLIFVIEVVLREFLIDRFATLGSQAWKHRLPSDVLTAFRESVRYERQIRWMSLRPHHPIYYIHFSHIRQIIQRADNWRELFQPVFGRKDIVVATLSEVEAIRNRVAHNRLVADADLAVVDAAFGKLLAALGDNLFFRFATEPTAADAIPDYFHQLRQEATECFRLCTSFRPIQPAIWRSVQSEWWFDEEYIQLPLNGIASFFQTMEQYAGLPRERGMGHRIEAWVDSKDLQGIYRKALDEFEVILAEVHQG